MRDLYYLTDSTILDRLERATLIRDYESGEYGQMAMENFILEKYGLEVKGDYGGIPIKNPFGKASGQLSSKLSQVRSDANAGLGFCVLKTVISQDEDAISSMAEWRVKAPKMLVEEIVGKSGKRGYTVTWKGRGWDKTFDAYLTLVKEALKLTEEMGMPIIPSVQYHLPKEGEVFRDKEYSFTTEMLEKVWLESESSQPFTVEHDFSATLSGQKHSREEILRWLQYVPGKICDHIKSDQKVLGIKLFNPAHEDGFQITMLEALNRWHSDKVDVITCFNRLFDFEKVFNGKKGIAYGGYDLSDRNLKALTEFNLKHHGKRTVPVSATGNINSGKMMLEYALRGATSGQIHTYFQIPSGNFGLKEGNRSKKALHELMFHPQEGLVAMMLTMKKLLGKDPSDMMTFLELSTLQHKMDLNDLRFRR